MNPKLRSSVSVVKINESVLEFFKTNTRDQIRIKVENDRIMEIVSGLDGVRNIKELSDDYKVDEKNIQDLIDFLVSKGIIETINPDFFSEYDKYRRVINFLEDYSTDNDQTQYMWNNIRTAKVLIIGVGSVGSWVAANLVQSGVQNICIMDGDTVDESNLHRQFGYTETTIGSKKIDALASRLLEMNENLDIEKYDCFLDGVILEELSLNDVDLVINCADYPSVDQTSKWIGKFCMKKKIPHIIGGGYNLHLSLIGQTVIPFKSACVNCYDMQLKEQNKLDPNSIKKLQVKNRKIGSFGPMCSIIASFIGMEAIKILSKTITPANVNRRGEFDIISMKTSYKQFIRRDDCAWCGKG